MQFGLAFIESISDFILNKRGLHVLKLTRNLEAVFRFCSIVWYCSENDHKLWEIKSGFHILIRVYLSD